MKAKIVHGRTGLWYENQLGKVFHVTEEQNHLVVCREAHATYLSDRGLYDSDLRLAKTDVEVYNNYGEKMVECKICSRYTPVGSVCGTCREALKAVKHLCQFEAGINFIQGKLRGTAGTKN